jgi:glycosyltransferase involved in cell wall biosynthesis
MREVTVFVGGSVGSDPYSPKTWSGIAPFLLKAMDSAGLLDKAVGIRVPRVLNSWLLAKNCNPNRAVWRKQFYFDPVYRNALTQAAKAVPVTSPVCLQIGHMFSLPTAFPGKKCISYHDGNLPELLSSGFGIEGVSRRRIDQALRYEEQTARQMTAIFTFSEYLRQSFIRDYHCPPDKVFNVGGAVNLTELPPPDPAKDYHSPRILFIGTEFNRKGGPQLLQAFRTVREAIPSAELHIAGPAQVDNLPPGAFSHGHLSKADPDQKLKLESLFRDSTLFVLPSLYEPFGIAPLEAMLYQLPAVVTNAWALPECVTPGINGDLVEKGSVEDLATKLVQLLSNPDRLATMGKQARELVLTRYTWPAVANRMSAIIKTL